MMWVIVQLYTGSDWVVVSSNGVTIFMVDNIVYGAGGVPMVKQPQEVKPVEKSAPKKEKKQPLQEIYGDDGFDEEHGDKE